MIRTLGFLDVSGFAANYLLRYKKHAHETDYGSLLPLRETDEEGVSSNLPLLKEWNSGRSLLNKLSQEAAPFLDGSPAMLMRAAIETLNAESVTPWSKEDDEYAKQILRLRVCIIPSPGAMTYSGGHTATLGMGLVNLIDHRLPCCETNFTQVARTHLVVDIRRIDVE